MRIWLGLGLTAALVAPASATGATAEYSNAGVLYVAGAGEANAVTVAPTLLPGDGETVVLSDPGATIEAGEGCQSLNAHTVHCADPVTGEVRAVRLHLGDRSDAAAVDGGYEFVTVDGGDGDDRARIPLVEASAQLSGGAGDDDLAVQPPPLASALGDFGFAIYGLNGGSGDDRLAAEIRASMGEAYLAGEDGDDALRGLGWLEGGLGDDSLTGDGVLDGGDGDDALDARDLPAQSDVLWCGAGEDTARADEADEADPDCESVERGLL